MAANRISSGKLCFQRAQTRIGNGLLLKKLLLPGIPSKPSPLYNCHKALGATFTDLAGYELPLYYTSNSQEHEQVRKNAGLFDLSHKACLASRATEQKGS